MSSRLSTWWGSPQPIKFLKKSWDLENFCHDRKDWSLALIVKQVPCSFSRYKNQTSDVTLTNYMHLNKLACSDLLTNIFHLLLPLNRNKTVTNTLWHNLTNPKFTASTIDEKVRMWEKQTANDCSRCSEDISCPREKLLLRIPQWHRS